MEELESDSSSTELDWTSTDSDYQISFLENRRLLRDENERRFENRVLPTSPRKRRKKVTIQRFSDFPKPVRIKKRPRYHTPTHQKIKQEEDIDCLLAEFGSGPYGAKTRDYIGATDVIDLTQDSSSDEFEVDETLRDIGATGKTKNSDGTSDISSESLCEGECDAKIKEINASSSDESLSIEYFNGDMSLPIFSRQNRVRTSTLYVVKAILDTEQDYVCTKHPIQVDSNCTFVVDTSKLRGAGDIKCDDCGAWKQTKTDSKPVSIGFDEDGLVASVQTGSNNTKKCYTLVRRHYTCVSSPDLSRHIASLTDHKGRVKPYQFVQYRFSGEEHSVNVRPHGNSKKVARPYKRTCPSTLKDLEEELKTHPPKRAVFKVDQKRGGILHADCVGDLPRNALQATHLRCKKTRTQSTHTGCISSSTDPLQSLVVKFKEQNGSHAQFIQSIHLVPDPTIVLFNKDQINDMEQFCTSQSKASVLGIDVTFNLGPFYVTLCTYQNLKVVNERGKHPIMIGPALIHSTKQHSNFKILFQEIINKAPSLATSLRAYGTDGEQALSSAAADAFPFATHLRCVNHLKDNVTDHLRKLLSPEAVIKEVLCDIFGTATEKGLLHASDKEFDAKLQLLKKRWDLLERKYKSSTPTVYRWFRLHVAPVIRDNVRSELLTDLGLEEDKYTQNNSESLNALVKRYVNFQKQDVFQFVNDLEECVQEQQNEVNKAMLGLGRWTLSQHCSQTSPKLHSWFSSMSQTEKNAALASTHSNSTLPQSATPLQPCQSLIPQEKCLSVPLTSVEGLLSSGELKSLWTKASRLLNENKVLTAPNSTPKNWWVASETSSSPHVVTISKANNKRYMCDKECVGWKTRDICAHCIAAAEHNNELIGFLLWFRSSKGCNTEGNLTKAVYHSTYKHAGMKKPPRRKYGDAVHLPVDQKRDRLPLDDISNVRCAVQNDHSYAKVTNGNSVQPESVVVKATPVHWPDLARRTDVSVTQENVVTNTTKAVNNNAYQNIHFTTCTNAQNVGTVNIGTVTTTQPLMPSVTTPSVVYSNPVSSLLSSLAPHLSIPSLLSSFLPPTPPNTTGQSVSVSLPKPANVKNQQPFFVANLSNRIKKCAGCNEMFRNSIEAPPEIILGHLERDWFPQNGKWQLGSLHNKYYHVRRSCILTRCSLYKFPSDFSTLQIPLSITLTDSMKDKLFKEFGLVV